MRKEVGDAVGKSLQDNIWHLMVGKLYKIDRTKRPDVKLTGRLYGRFGRIMRRLK